MLDGKGAEAQGASIAGPGGGWGGCPAPPAQGDWTARPWRLLTHATGPSWQWSPTRISYDKAHITVQTWIAHISAQGLRGLGSIQPPIYANSSGKTLTWSGKAAHHTCGTCSEPSRGLCATPTLGRPLKACCAPPVLCQGRNTAEDTAQTSTPKRRAEREGRTQSAKSGRGPGRAGAHLLGSKDPEHHALWLGGLRAFVDQNRAELHLGEPRVSCAHTCSR